MKLEVGMYIRTKEGNIEKICSIENEHIYTNEDYLSWYPSYNTINKASHNIIDLIEVGDYVNGCRVIAVNIAEIVGHYSYVKCINDNVFKENEIKSIVTKEMFESMQYEVK